MGQVGRDLHVPQQHLPRWAWLAKQRFFGAVFQKEPKKNAVWQATATVASAAEKRANLGQPGPKPVLIIAFLGRVLAVRAFVSGQPKQANSKNIVVAASTRQILAL